MKRRDLISLLSSTLIVLPFRIQAGSAKIRHIGYIGGFPTLEQGAMLSKAFLDGLAQYGWVDGKNVVVTYRWANAQVDVAKAQAIELLNMGAELIVAPVAGAYDGAHQATSKVPIVFCSHGDPIGLGHAKSLATPGGNMTGLSYYQAELSDKKLALLLEVAPTSSTIGVIWDPKQPVTHTTRASVEAAIEKRGLRSLFRAVSSADDIRSAISELREEIHSLFIVGSPLTYNCNELLAELLIACKIPAIFPFVEDAGKGALLVYAPDLADLYRRCGGYVDKILKGADPADVPIEQPTKYQMIVNLRTAREIELTVPATMIAMADQIIE